MADPKTRRTPAWLVLLAIAGLFALYFVRMGSYPLADPDEPVYGQIAKEMAAGGDWLTPHYGGKPWFDKPPLFYWLSAASMKLVGPTELACRLPSAILAVALVLLLYAFVKHDFGRRAALFSAIAMATCLQTIILARAAVTDMALCFCLLAALYAYRRWLDSQPRISYSLIPNPYSLACGTMAGLGMLAKGPVAPLLLFTTFLIHLCWTRQLKRLISLDALVGVASTLIVGLPWFVAMYVINHDAFVHQFIEVNNLARFTTAEHRQTTGAWYSIFLNIPVLFAFFFPWSVFLPSGIVRMWKSERGTRNGETNAYCLLPIAYFAVVFVFFSISKTQLVTYIFPLYPAAALFVGVLFDRAASGELGCKTAIRRGLIAGIIIALLLAVALMKYSRRDFPEANTAAIALGAVLLLTFVAAFFVRGDARRVGWAIGSGMVVFTLVLMFGALPVATARISTRDIVRRIPPARNIGAILELRRKPSLLFYLGFWPKQLSNTSDADRLLGKEVSAWVICKNREAALLRAEGYTVTARAGDLCVIANKSAVPVAATLRGRQSRKDRGAID